MKTFKEYLKDMQEETTSADIATVDVPLKVKKCKCGKEDCKICKGEKND